MTLPSKLARWPALLLASSVPMLVLSLALLMSLPAQAQRSAPPMPPELAQSDAALVPRGQARFRVWGFEVYDASLWSSAGFVADAFDAQPLALELRYLRDFSAQDIAQRSLKEMQRQSALKPEQEKRWLGEMLRVFPDIRKGDRLLGLHRPGQGAVFWFNGQLRGEIRDADFARLFFGIWLSSRTSEPALRSALLGSAP
jgi:hypothetical protein